MIDQESWRVWACKNERIEKMTETRRLNQRKSENEEVGL